MNIDTPRSALTSNTMVCEVSRLFEDESTLEDRMSWRRRSSDAMRVADLLSLIEAVALHDSIYVLPAQVSKDADSLGLRNLLIERRVLKLADTTKLHAALADSILATLSSIKNPVTVAGSAASIGRPIDFESRIKPELAKFLMLKPSAVDPRLASTDDDERSLYAKFREDSPRIDDARDFFDEGGGSSQALYAESLEDCGKALIGWIEYHSSGAYEHCTSIVRDMYYVLAAEALELPYWPQSTRREFTSKFPNFFDKQLLLQLYSKLAAEFKCTVADIYDDHKEEIAYIPPFASLVLSRARTRGDIPREILQVREEFSELRMKIGELEMERRLARSIGARLKIKKAQRDLLNEVSSAFASPGLISLEGILRYTPNLAKPVTKPADISSYSPDLLLMPGKQIVRWWKRRPIAKFFHLADKLKSTEDYPKLIARHFGDEVSLRGQWA